MIWHLECVRMPSRYGICNLRWLVHVVGPFNSLSHTVQYFPHVSCNKHSADPSPVLELFAQAHEAIHAHPDVMSNIRYSCGCSHPGTCLAMPRNRVLLVAEDSDRDPTLITSAVMRVQSC
jgi:hypothetical protein